MKSKLQQYKILLILLILAVVLLAVFFSSFSFILGIVELFAILVCGQLVFFDQRNAASKFAWILTLLFLPLIGIILYFLLGKEPHQRRLPKKQIEDEQKLQDFVSEHLQKYPEIIQNEHPLSEDIFHLSSKYPTNGNYVNILSEGKEAFASLLKDIGQAQDHIHVFYFIIKGDETGTELVHALIEKAKEGVKIRFMYDSLGSIAFPNQLLEELRSQGIEVRTYDLLNSPWLSNKANWRNHRKMVIIDGEIAHVGGMNIGNEYSGRGEKFVYWRDTNIRLQGPSVIEVQECFIYDWLFLDKGQYTLSHFLVNDKRYFPLVENETAAIDSEIVQVIYGGPYDKERVIKDSFVDLISKAAVSIKIAMPYFVPDEETLGALRRAARCGVKVQLIIPGKGDRGISYHGTNSFIDELLSAGIEVYAYDRSSFIHCKYMIIDDHAATVGSTNFDIRSFYLNHELSLFIYGPSPAIEELTDQFAADLSNSGQVNEAMQAKRTLLEKCKEKISALFVPIL
ncbi:cardiolipin synthase [Enterococcus sp. BWB1-3]|uniref:cardiolipin synthase n=1 Tax=unclassified Enterococcus TaxID=2608891 RepID=UPI0019208FC0|nr:MULTISPECIES: cardiolipin synthase [unclassified Enterococcus]MBL1230180.1 cardiolipin synthase [Enterococcus sp. BWB1-3]MCB5953180.1 cardiolipin synthase [Enterococcus sp. BWT-B8]